MDRDSFLDYLTRAVNESFITEAEAVELLKKFDAGDIDEPMLPLPLDEAVTETTEQDMTSALLVLVTLGIISKGFKFPRMSEKQQEQAATRLQDRFAGIVRGLAPVALENVSGWQATFGRTIQEHIIQQAVMGRLRPLLPSELATLDRVIRAQQAFASRFADEHAAGLLMGNSFSVEYIGHRSELYNGEARAEFYRQKEEEEAEDGTVYDYISVDDNGTCQPCLDAEAAGPYLAGEGEYPGTVCEGRGFCRCTREARFAPDEARELRGELAA